GSAALHASTRLGQPLLCRSMPRPMAVSALRRWRPETAVSRHRDAVADGVTEFAFERDAERVDGQFLPRDSYAQQAGIVLIMIFQPEGELVVLRRHRVHRCSGVVAIGILLELVRQAIGVGVSATTVDHVGNFPALVAAREALHVVDVSRQYGVRKDL